MALSHCKRTFLLSSWVSCDSQNLATAPSFFYRYPSLQSYTSQRKNKKKTATTTTTTKWERHLCAYCCYQVSYFNSFSCTYSLPTQVISVSLLWWNTFCAKKFMLVVCFIKHAHPGVSHHEQVLGKEPGVKAKQEESCWNTGLKRCVCVCMLVRGFSQEPGNEAKRRTCRGMRLK